MIYLGSCFARVAPSLPFRLVNGISSCGTAPVGLGDACSMFLIGEYLAFLCLYSVERTQNLPSVNYLVVGQAAKT